MAGHFSEFGMIPELVKGIEEIGWLLPTDIQAEAIPLILGGGDVLMAAETGSGKTGAFSLPVIQVVQENLLSTSSRGVNKETKEATARWEMNKLDRSASFAISADGLLCQSREQRQWQGSRSTLGVKTGKHYYEVKVTDEGLCRVGYSTDTATLDVGCDRESFGFGGTGKKSNNKQFDTYGEPFGINDVIGCFLNLDKGTIKFSKNGKDLKRAFDIPDGLYDRPFFASVTLKNAELQFNFGEKDFQFPPTGGYVALCEAIDTVKSTKLGAPTKFTNKSSPAALIMEPSRELATQTHDQITLFKKYMPDPKLRNVLLVGGQNSRDQIQALKDGVDIVTGTPGKLDDFISSGHLKLDQVRFLIFDEVDGLLNQNQRQLIERMYDQCPKFTSDGKRLQLIVCSATLHNFDVKKLAEKIMHFPTWIDLKGKDSVPDTVHHVVCTVDPKIDTSWQKLKTKIKTDGIHAKDDTRSASPESLSEAIKILKGEYVVNAIRKLKMDQGIVFCRTKLDCDNLEQYLRSQANGEEFSCVCLHADRSPDERTRNLKQFKERAVKFLICTDVAARGLDVKGIPFVINVTLPDDKTNYVHRIGRVGRADRMGLAVSFVSKYKEKVWYHVCRSRGRGCNNTKLKDEGGCSVWYDEQQYLGEIEEHLGETIAQISAQMNIPVNEFDGKVVYGTKKTQNGTSISSSLTECALRALNDAGTDFANFIEGTCIFVEVNEPPEYTPAPGWIAIDVRRTIDVCKKEKDAEVKKPTTTKTPTTIAKATGPTTTPTVTAAISITTNTNGTAITGITKFSGWPRPGHVPVLNGGGVWNWGERVCRHPAHVQHAVRETGRACTGTGTQKKYHSEELAPAVQELASLEKQAQLSFLRLKTNWKLAAPR